MYIFSNGDWASRLEERDSVMSRVHMNGLPKAFAKAISEPGVYEAVQPEFEGEGTVVRFKIKLSGHQTYPAQYCCYGGAYICKSFLAVLTGFDWLPSPQFVRVKILKVVVA